MISNILKVTVPFSNKILMEPQYIKQIQTDLIETKMGGLWLHLLICSLPSETSQDISLET